MTDDVVISVRGEASTRVMPDEARIISSVLAFEQTKADALRTVSGALDAIRDAMAALGGEASTAERSRVALSWTATSASSYDEFDHDSEKGRRRTGRVVASVDLRIFVRDFALLDQLGDLLAGRSVNVHQVLWHVDDDNPGWPVVRAAAIGAARTRADDYARALDGSIVRLEQVADAGLMADSGHEQSRSMSFATSGGGHRESPTLDPDVQVLRASVDVRAIASVRES